MNAEVKMDNRRLGPLFRSQAYFVERFRCLLVWVLLVAFIGSGCTTTTRVGSEAMDSDWASLNQRIREKDIQITLRDGRALKGKQGEFVPPDLRWYDETASSWRTEPIAALSKVEWRRTGRGALDGLGIGILTGALIGAIHGNANYEECDPSEFCIYDRRDETIAGAIVLGLLGGLIGALIGASVGHQDMAEFTAPPELKNAD